MALTTVAPEQEFLRVPQVATVIGMSAAFVRKVIREGKGPAVIRLGKSPVISRRALAEWMQSRTEPARSVAA